MLSSQIAMDELFDLDLALTMPDDSTINELNNKHQLADDDQSKAAARHLLAEMPTVVMGEGGQSCAVCAERFCLGGAGKRIPCGHVFHENCISRWLSINNSCPLCRQKLFSN